MFTSLLDKSQVSQRGSGSSPIKACGSKPIKARAPDCHERLGGIAKTAVHSPTCRPSGSHWLSPLRISARAVPTWPSSTMISTAQISCRARLLMLRISKKNESLKCPRKKNAFAQTSAHLPFFAVEYSSFCKNCLVVDCLAAHSQF